MSKKGVPPHVYLLRDGFAFAKGMDRKSRTIHICIGGKGTMYIIKD